MTPMYFAAQQGRLDVVDRLIAAAADINKCRMVGASLESWQIKHAASSNAFGFLVA